MTRTEIDTELAGIGRPAPRLGGGREGGGFKSARVHMGDLAKSIAEIKAWDAAHPAAAARWHQLHALIDKIDREEAEALRVQRLAERANKAVQESGAGARSIAAATRPRPTEAVLAVRQWLAEVPPAWMLVLRGSPGTGKTVAAIVAERQVAETGRTVGFRKAGEVLRLSSFAEGAEEFARLKRVQFLAIDDFGSEALTDYGRGLLVELLDARYEASALTLVTANPTWPQLIERLGQRIHDRIRHGGKVVELTGHSMRGAA